MGANIIRIKDPESMEAFIDLRKVEIFKTLGYREFRLIIGDKTYVPYTSKDAELVMEYICAQGLR